jgi:hypothetical protein
MRVAFRISLLAIGLASWLGTGGAWAGALVEFPHVSERGPATLVRYLARPDRGLSELVGGERHSVEHFPAVVVLHHDKRLVLTGSYEENSRLCLALACRRSMQ